MPKAGKNLFLGSLMVVVVFAAASALLYGAAKLIEPEKQASAEAGAAEDISGGVAAGPVSVRLVAKDLKFDRRSIAASPGADVTVTMDNQEAIIHNVAFYTNNRATEKISVGELFQGPGTRELKFKAPSSPGAYFFRCDVHPDTMTGTFSVR